MKIIFVMVNMAGGGAVAIGELTDGLVIELDKVKKKYDEHGRLSKTAGSVASLNWVESEENI